MRYFLFSIILFFSVSVFGQDYDKQWNKVYAFELDGKTKSASEEVDKIYKKAKKDKNDEQIIKSFLYQSKFILSLEENGQQKVIQNLKNEIKTSSEPNTSILNYIYAKSLQSYSNQNGYKHRNNTKTKILPDNFLEWHRDDFETEIENLYLKSIQSKAALTKTPFSKYDEVIDYGTLGKKEAQTLYDFLMFEYLDKIKEKYYYEQIADSIKIRLLSEPKTFVSIDFSTLKYSKALSVYQELEKEYLSKNKTSDLERIWINRLDFITNRLNVNKEFSIKSYEYFSQNSYVPYYKYQAILAQAQLYNQLANKNINTDYNKKSLILLDTLVNARKKSDDFIEGENLRHQIIQKTIDFQTTKDLFVGENSRMYINYKNVDTLFGYYYKIDENFNLDNKKDTDSLIKKLLETEKFANSFQFVLENKKDYFNYSTEVLLPKLDKGNYLLIVGDELKWIEYKDFTYSHSFVNVTDISFSHKRTEDNNKHHIRVTHRKTGKPLEGAKIVYGNSEKLTDNFGEVFFERMEIKESQNNDFLVYYQDNFYKESIYEYYFKKDDENEEDDNWIVSSEIYTDRAIYRPGQTLYYKGIIHQNKNGKTSVVSESNIEIEFKDNNYQTLETKKLITNEFGSFSGEFIIPKNIPTGDLIIQTREYGHELFGYDFRQTEISVKVEEYKRPTFEVIFDKIEKSFVINDTITITGKAKTFSGVMLSNAKVDFIINRNSRYSKYNYSRYINESEQIDFGKTTTDKDGNFTIKFKATTNEDVEKEGLPIFSYSINAIVTDSQGETRSNTTNAKVGFHNLELSLNASDKVNSKEKLIVDVNSTNLNGAFLEANITLKVFKKSNPEKIQFQRQTPVPENQTISKEDFEKLFPYESYDNQEEETTEELVHKTTFNTKDGKSIVLEQIKNWKSGSYRIEISSEDLLSKQNIIKEKWFTLTNDKDTYSVDKQILTYEILNKDYKKDGFIRYKLSTATNLLYVFVDSYYENKQHFKKIVEIKNGNIIIDIPIHKNQEGTVQNYFFYTWENQKSYEFNSADLPYKNTSHSFEIVKMNNKLEPNSPQMWSFVVKDSEGKEAISEVLASMYDMSLDEFNTSSWTPIYNEKPHNYVNYFQVYNGNKIQEYIYYKTYFKPLYRNIKEDSFNWFDYDFSKHSVSSGYLRFLRKKVGSDVSSGYVIGYVISSDDGFPLPRASIVIKGTTKGTQTDIDGWFQIQAKNEDILVISNLGMKTKEIKVSEINQNNNIIYLDSDLIEEIIIEGYRFDSQYVIFQIGKGDYGNDFNYFRGNVYRTVSKPRSNVAAITVTSDTIEGRPNAGFIETLQGQVPGLMMNQASGQPGGGKNIILRGKSSINGNTQPLYVIDGVPLSEEQFAELNQNDIADVQVLKDTGSIAIYGNRGANGVIVITTKKGLEELSKVQTRQNLKETAFFYPHITTDKNGNLSFNFTSPEALTSWKFRMLSHTKDALAGYFESVVTTQKDLMIQPNMPRFVRETDTIVIKAKVSNLSNEIHNGMAMLQLININDNNNIKIKDEVKQFKTAPKGSETLSWEVVIPKGTQGLEYKITAKAGNFTDGEQNIIPVLPNRILVNESLPIWVRENSKKDFVFENMKNNDSKTLENNSFTLEYTSNPTWIAIGSLPYLMEYQHECSEQIFSKLYANSIASHILEQNPKIKEVFEKWSENPTSKLEQNEELKNILLSETPWIRDAQSEEEQKKNLALLFDLQKVKSKSEEVLRKLEEQQKSNGAFGWFEGSPENTFITTHITTGFGHLKKLGIDIKSDEITKKMIAYLDRNFTETKNPTIQNRMIIRPYNQLHYLYARSFYPEITPNDSLKQNIDKEINNYKEKWLTLSLYEKGMLALVLHRNSDTKTAKKILEHFKESAVINTDFGMYWLDNVNSPYWYKAPVETQALLIETFSEIYPNDATIEELKVWLIKQKQTKHWSTTKSTTLAVNALLLGKKDFVSLKDKTTFSVGKEKIKSQKLENKESETGYIKLSWKADEITKDFAEVSIENKSESVGFGGLYWSYFEELDNIKKSDSELMKIEKELYLKKATQKGSELLKITSETKLKLGDLVTVRLVLKISEEMDFVHLKDMRASGFEPVDVLSGYEYKDGLSFYKSTKDVATHFFFDSLNKGTYVLEYDVRVNNLGSFSNGITTLQSMYAPEYSSHTSSVRVVTE